MGLLDKQSRVIDFVLTERGRRLYAAGKLRFSYFAVFDDGIDYSPYSTGSLNDQERELAIEMSLVEEASTIPEVGYPYYPLEPRSHVFTAEGGYEIVPSIASPTSGSRTVEFMQEQSRRGLKRFGTSVIDLEVDVDDDDELNDDRFTVSVYMSGSNGYRELEHKRDLSSRRVYDPFLAMSLDDELVDEDRAETLRKKA